MPFGTVEQAIEDIRNGRFVVVADDEDRENEGDLICAAQLITPEMVNVMMRAKGMICLAVTNERADQLGLGSMGDENTEAMIAKAREGIVAKMSEMNIPLNPNSTNTFNIEHAYGNAEDAIRYVEELEKAGADEIMCMIQMGTIPQWAMLETIRQFGENVIPHFRAKEKAAQAAHA